MMETMIPPQVGMRLWTKNKKRKKRGHKKEKKAQTKNKKIKKIKKNWGDLLTIICIQVAK